MPPPPAQKKDPLPVTTPGVAGPVLAWFDSPTDIAGTGNLEWDNVNSILSLNGSLKLKPLIAGPVITALGGPLSSEAQLALARGGTNADLSGTGAAKSYLKQLSAGAAITVGTIAAVDVPTTPSGNPVGTGRTISTTAPITGGGDLSADRTIALTTPLAVASGGTATSTAFTAGSVVFAGASGVYNQDNANLFYDAANKRLGIGTASPSYLLQANLPSTAYLGMVVGDEPYSNTNNLAAFAIERFASGQVGFSFKTFASPYNTVLFRCGQGTERADARVWMAVFSNNGYVGLGGQTNPSQVLDVTGKVHISDLTTAGATAVTHSGNVLGTVASDERLKKNIQPIPNALNMVKQLNGVFYEWKNPENDPGRHVGITAQNLREVLPELTFQQSVRDGEPYYGVHYERVCALLIEAVKEQQTQIDKLKAEVAKLKRD